MKYIKTFEGLNQSMDMRQLQEFCDEYLVDLVDIGFEIEIYQARENSITDFWVIKLSKTAGTGFSIDKWKLFNWNSVKDKFIPFYQVLKDNYIIKHNNYGVAGATQVYFSTRVGEHKWVKGDNIVSDNFNESFKKKDLMYIEVRLYGEKSND